MPLHLFSTTWHVLGLLMVATHTLLGLFEILWPHRAASFFLALATTTGTSESTTPSKPSPLFTTILGDKYGTITFTINSNGSINNSNSNNNTSSSSSSSSNNTRTNTSARTNTNSHPPHTHSSKTNHANLADLTVSLLLPLIVFRDLSLGVAIFALASAGRWQEAGTVILAGAIANAADCVAIWKRTGMVR